MKKFLYKVLIFIVLCFALAAIADYPYTTIIQKTSYDSFESWYDLMHGKIDADVLIMGNSRARLMISPIVLDSILGLNSYNIGMDGSPIKRQIVKYEICRQHNRKPFIVVQNIDCWSMSAPKMGYENEQFYPYFYDSDFRDIIFSTEHFSFAEKYIPLYRYHGFLPSLFSKSPKTLKKGYVARDWKWKGDEFQKVDSLLFQTDKATVDMFDNYLSDLKDEGIKVVFVYSPLYIGATKKLSNEDEMRIFYQYFADKYDIPILDYTYSAISFDTTYFYNAMHLNKTGAELFSDSLANDLIKLGILPER